MRLPPPLRSVRELIRHLLRVNMPIELRFVAVRGRFDPARRFRNSYTDRVLGLPGS